jgi:hypothetical protein
MKTRNPKLLGSILPLVGLGLTLLVASCHKQESPKQPASSIVIETRSDGIHLQTSQAEFLLTPSGALLARQKKANTVAHSR